jgi:flagellar biosynthesis/type III secretory pathway chaperone
MHPANPTQALLDALEDHLVKEFRVCSRLRDLTRDERATLVKNDVPALASIVERKEAALDELARLDDARRGAADRLALLLGVHDETLSIARLLSALEPETAEKFGRLREGILAMMDQIADLTHGNGLLAASALERNTALQTFLLDQYQPLESYAPPGMRPVSEPPVAMGFDQRT